MQLFRSRRLDERERAIAAREYLLGIRPGHAPLCTGVRVTSVTYHPDAIYQKVSELDMGTLVPMSSTEGTVWRLHINERLRFVLEVVP